jgi:1,4-alpha-glucan branching enzyme
LHSHLPYYRKAGMWPFGEENLYEAIAETYIPLLNAFEDLREEGIAAKVTIGVTPVLAEQLADEHLKQGFEEYMQAFIDRIEKDRFRYSDEGMVESATWEKGERIAAAKAAYAERLAAAKAAEQAEAEPARPAWARKPDPEEVQSELTASKPKPTLTDDEELAVAQEPASAKPSPAAQAPATAPTATVAEEPAEAEAEDEGDDQLKADLEAIEEEFARPRPVDPRRELAEFYYDWYTGRLADFRTRYRRDLLAAFKSLQDDGCIEIITCAATHGFSPLLSRDSSLNAQYKVGVETYKKYFGRQPKGVWLPECAYRPAVEGETEYRPPIDQFLRENGLEYFFTETHAVQGGKTAGYRRMIGPYGAIEYIPMPERPQTGLSTFQGYWLPENPVAVYARNEAAGMQVWAVDGYPGDGWYREFHKRDGNSGMQYWRVTGKNWDLAHKDFYNPQMALQRVHDNSDHYVGLIYDELKRYWEANERTGHLVVTFDTELFGHWWFEGIEWIKQMIRKMSQGSGIKRATVGEILAEDPPELAYQLPESSWGAGGHFHVWMNPQVEFMWPIIHRCEQRMEELVRFVPTPRSPLEARALAQAARELLLLEGSDWPFLVTTGQAKTYAIDRFNEHVERFDALADAILAGTLTEAKVAAIEAIDNAFADIDYHDFKDRQERASVTK